MYSFNYCVNPFMNFYMQNLFGMQNYFVNPIQSYYSLNNPTPVSIFQQNNHTTYNKAKGEYLVQNALAGLPAHSPNPPMCAKYVKNAIVNSGLGNYVYGNGEQTKYMLRGNQNFMEITAKGKDLKNLPAGSVVVYDANEIVQDPNGNTSQICKDGHTLFATGDGTGISDRKESYIPITDNAYVFIPV